MEKFCLSCFFLYPQLLKYHLKLNRCCVFFYSTVEPLTLQTQFFPPSVHLAYLLRIFASQVPGNSPGKVCALLGVWWKALRIKKKSFCGREAEDIQVLVTFASISVGIFQVRDDKDLNSITGNGQNARMARTDVTEKHQWNCLLLDQKAEISP